MYQEPLILAQMEYIEGNGDWVSKWLNISQEPADVLGYVKKYARLWLKERKKANLNVVTNKFKTVYADSSDFDKKVV